MKQIASVIVFLCFLGGIVSFRDIVILKTIEQECLHRLPHSRYDYGPYVYRPVAYTLESFISLVEKTEHKYPQSNIFDITNMLLERFYFSELILNSKRELGRDLAKRHRSSMLRKMLDQRSGSTVSQVEAFFQEGFTDDERCALYFMIAHNINDTYRGSDFDRLNDRVTPEDQASGNDPKIDHSLFPREQGLVSLHSDSVNAVAIGRVLVGIAAGEHQGQFKSLKDIDSETDSKSELSALKLECVSALTIGDAVANAEIQPRTGHVTKYGPPGSWNTTMCPTEYKLKSDKITTTDAEIRGSIDGYILGYHVNELKNQNSNGMTLSRLIRMYYSKHGIRVGGSISKIGFCERSSVIGALDEETLKNTVTNVGRYYHFKQEKITSPDFEGWYSDYSSYINSQVQEKPLKHICHQTVTTIENKLPETPVDVFFVLDVTEHNTNGMREQIEVLGHLTGYLDIGYGAGSMTVLLNSRNEVSEVKMNLNNATNSGCVPCTLERLSRSEFARLERDSVSSTLEMLNRTLREYKEKRLREDGVPARVVIYFHYDTNTAKDNMEELDRARMQLRHGHRGVQIFAIGTGEILEKIASDQNTKFTDIMEPMDRALKLREEISKVPGILQYEECNDRRYKGEGNHVYNGYVTPDEKQLWAMYPEFFLKSYHIEMKFKAENGKIKVCYERGVDDPSKLDHNQVCKEADNTGTEIVFRIDNPCEGRDVNNCLPFNFAVIGLPRENILGGFCTDHNCRRFDQIKYTVSHKGVSCNGALGLLASPFAILVTLYALLQNY